MENDGICITGLGAVTPFGVGVESLFKAMLEGRSAVSSLARFRLSSWCPSTLGACLNDFALEGQNLALSELTGNAKEAERASPQLRLAWASSELAIRDAGLDLDEEMVQRMGVFVASSRFSTERMEYILERSSSGRLAEVMPLRLEWIHPHGTAAHLSYLFKIKGPCLTFASSCCSSNQALECAMLYIRAGHIDAALVVSSDVLSRFQYHAEAKAGFLSPLSDPENSPRPYDRDARGAVLSEGSAALVLERGSLAGSRSAGRRVWVHASENVTRPMPDRSSGDGGHNFEEAVRLLVARTKKHGLDLIFSDGRGVPLLDRHESMGIKKALGKAAESVPVTSIQGGLGHTGGTNGLLQILNACLAMESGLVPPIAGLRNPGDGCELDYIMGTPRRSDAERVCVINHSWNGDHGAFILARE